MNIISHVSFFFILLTYYLWLSSPTFAVDGLHFSKVAPGLFRRVFGDEFFTSCFRIKNGVEENYEKQQQQEGIGDPFCIQRSGNAVLILLCLIWHTLDVFLRFYLV